ncbi:dTDP-4-dehydrorhamnose 3,5-epimerase [Akkermansiaceae bacterium]|nr:dTDP-4-dehydrorhamnose 3,5-epimerase [Akkermansiaceae bacterium]
MKFQHLQIPDLVLCEPDVFRDDRGYFLESFRQDQLDKFLGYSIEFCQENESKSTRGVLRGLHYQLPPVAQTKLVSVIVGTVLDVAVDLRKNSTTFGKHVAVELSAENKYQLLIPRGFAHGFVVLSKEAIFSYKVDNYYAPNFDRGIVYDDPTLAIDWKLCKKDLKISAKDMNAPLLGDSEIF